MQAFLFILLHVPLAFLMSLFPLLSTIHAALILVVGFFWVTRETNASRIIALLGYITGAELLWRGTGAQVFWEYGKYVTIFLLIILLFRFIGTKRADQRVLVYFVLLLPSIVLLPEFDREAISANLAGPMALAVAVLWYSQIKITKEDLKTFILAVMAPIMGVSALAWASLLSFSSVTFYTIYDAGTIASLGPNQVSSIFGLGCLAALLYLILSWENKSIRLFMMGFTILMLVQTALTFSRGGLWTALGSIAVIVFFIMQDNRYRTIFLFFFVLLILLISFVIFPVLDEFTNDTLSARLTDLSLTGRDKIIEADLLAFKENPLFGVGPGQSRYYHAITFRESNTHTEYSRLVAEHGFLGLISLIILLVIVLQRTMQREPALSKAIVLSFTAWSLLFMFHSATRLVAPSILFGMASATFILSPEVEQSQIK